MSNRDIDNLRVEIFTSLKNIVDDAAAGVNNGASIEELLRSIHEGIETHLKNAERKRGNPEVADRIKPEF